MSRVLRLLENRDPPRTPTMAAGDRGYARKLWILACTDPYGSSRELVPYLRRIAGPRWTRPALWRIGSAAWLLDESTTAVRLLQEAMARIQAPGRQGASGGGLTALAWLYVDTGRWDEALEAAAEAADLAEANPDGHGHRVRRHDHRDRPGHARGLRLPPACTPNARWPGSDPAESGLIAARAWRALGVAALAEGSHLLAYTQLRRLFSEQGAPVHNIFSYLGVADLATAAVRADRRARRARTALSARSVISAGRHLPGWISSSPGPAASSPIRTAPARISPPRSPTPPESSGRSSARSSASTTPNGCAGSAGSTKPSRNW